MLPRGWGGDDEGSLNTLLSSETYHTDILNIKCQILVMVGINTVESIPLLQCQWEFIWTELGSDPRTWTSLYSYVKWE